MGILKFLRLFDTRDCGNIARDGKDDDGLCSTVRSNFGFLKKMIRFIQDKKIEMGLKMNSDLIHWSNGSVKAYQGLEAMKFSMQKSFSLRY